MTDNSREAGVARVRKFADERLGGLKPRMETMARHFPDCIEHWLRARDAASRPPSEGGALTEREKELVILGMEITARHKSVEYHTRKAMEAGATSREVAEVAALCILIEGMVTYVECGERAVLAAEAYEAEMKSRK